MKILVYGLGALGTVYACLLKNQGHQVTGIDLPQVASVIQDQGLHVEGIWGNYSNRLDDVTSSINSLKEDYDLIIITVKAYETAAVAELIQPLVKDHTMVMLAQNGYGNFEAAQQFIPPENLILGRVIFGAVTKELGISEVTVIADDVLLGSPPGLVPTTVLNQWASLMSDAFIPTRVSHEIMNYVWAKIIYNSALNPLGAILEVPYGTLAQIPSTKQLMDEIIQEIFAVLEAVGQPTPWPNAQAYLESFYGQMVPSTAAHRASMLQDIQRGRKTEIDALNGAVVRLGSQFGVPTPVNRVIVAVLKGKESRSQIDPD